MVSACTIIARNYLVHARVLAKSFFEHHPGGRFTVLLIDDEAGDVDGSGEPFDVRRLSEIGLDRDEIGRLVSIYDVTELATAVKPPFLRHLLSAGVSDVIYLDPDIKLYGSLDKASHLAREHGIVLTPHMIGAMPRDGRRVDEFHILAAGIYNLGFIAVGAQVSRFIDWWWERTRRDARIDPARMMFTDQRWMDFAPSLFDHIILKDPGYNVAYWNLHERDLQSTTDGYTVNGKPLTFFHFSGFDGARPYLLSKHQGDRPRILLSERPTVAQICREYLASLEAAGLSSRVGVGYGWDRLPSGLLFDRQMRQLYREALDAWEAGKGPEPPNPFDPRGEERFVEWLNEPVGGGLQPFISRYLLAVYDARPDVQRAFPVLASDLGWRYLEWVMSDGVSQHGIPKSLQPLPSTPTDGTPTTFAAVSELTPGVNVAGYFRAEVGVGEAARLLTSAIEAAEIPHSTVAYDATPSRKEHPFLDRGSRTAPHDVNVLCVNADQTAAFAREAGPRFFEGRYTIGYWFWELERFPTTMHQAFDYVDEVWAATRFVAGGIREIGRRPVHTLPLPVPIPRCSPDVTRESLHLPSNFLFLFVFDFFSITERKNPIGLIRAFDRAFKPGEGPVLVIKTINGDRKLSELERVRAAAGGRDDILVIDDYYSVTEKNSLISLCDSYVSLHRSEGLGLTMAEAMGLEKPVIATAYSGNLDFMTPENSYLVDYVKGAVPKGCDPYPAGSQWADPNLEQAAALMRRVVEARSEAQQKASQARRDILTRHNANISGAAVRARLDQIHQMRRHVTTSAAPARIMSLDSTHKTSAASETITAALDRAASLLTPTPSVESGRPFRGALLFFQDVLFRTLRPYWWQQRQLQGLLVNSLREVAEESARAARLEPRQREALEALWGAVHSLEASNQELARAVGVRDDRFGQGEEATGLIAQLSTLQQSVSTFQASASEHLKALTEQLASTTARTDELGHRLYAAPHMDNPQRFSYSDEAGKQVLGFRSGRSADSDLYPGFEDIFRGNEAFIRDRQRTYLTLLKPYERVIDIGCGRGELLDLLKEAGIPSVGVDLDEAMVRRSRSKGHIVEQQNGNDFLRDQADGSVPAIFAAQVVEHLTVEDFLTFLRLSRAKLRPGGLLIFETVNPHALEAFKTFWTDLTHQRPIFPEVALAWCWLIGFDEARVMYPNGMGDQEQDRITQGEYAIIARKGPSDR